MRARQIDKFCLVLWPDRLEIWQDLGSTIRPPVDPVIEAGYFLLAVSRAKEIFEEAQDRFDVWSVAIGNWK